MRYKEEETVFLNGRFLPAQEAKISPLIPGFLCGRGLFETLRSYGNNIVYFDRHLLRLERSAGLLGLRIPYSSGRIRSFVKEAAKKCNCKDIRIRISLWDAGDHSGLMIQAKGYVPPQAEKYRKGLSVCVSALRQAENYSFSRIKLIDRILYESAFRQAKAGKYDEALVLNNRGYLCEASRSNLFFIKGRALFTPSLKCSCLPGVTRQVVFDLAQKRSIEIAEGEFTVEDLLDSEGAFLTNSLIGIMPLTRVNNLPVNSCRIPRLTRMFMRQYNRLLFGAGVSVII